MDASRNHPTIVEVDADTFRYILAAPSPKESSLEEEVDELNAALDRFTYSTSHDLRGPLMTLLGLIELSETEVDEVRKKGYFGLMKKTIHKMDFLIKEVTDVGMNKRLPVMRDPINFEELIRSTRGSLVHLSNYQRVRFSLSIQSDGTRFYSDAYRLKLILNSLLSNAFEFADLNKPEPTVRVSVEVQDLAARIEIADNGIGIPSEYQQKVFELFFRAHESDTGSGIGLYLVEQSVRMLRGNVQLESATGVGTTFRLQVPNLR